MKFTLTFLMLMLPFAAQAQAPAKPEAAKATPEAALTKADAMKDKEEVQMSEEELDKARKEEEALVRKKAAEDAAAERERQRQARLALCVIKPVMSDDDIEKCRVAYRE